MFVLLYFVLLAPIVFCEVNDKDGAQQFMGLDTVHFESKNAVTEGKIKIDKDTIITRNLKLEKRGKQKNVDKKQSTEEEREPDWSYNSIPQEISPYVEEFKRNMSECLKEVQATDTRQVKQLSPKRESPVHGDCLIACVLKRNHVIVHGKAHKGNLLALVSKFFGKDTHMMKKLEKHLDRCVEMSVHHTSDCDLARRLNDCTNDLMMYHKQKLVVNY